jgi:phosphatidylinositol-4,5-bisphosphate 3-kinase
MKTLYEMTKMLILPEFSWTFVGEADSFRRRPFPLKFLQYECSDFPCYVFESELSKAFNDIGIIQTEVDLSEYTTKIKPNCRKENVTYIYSKEESLVTSTQEFIKNILRWIYKNFRKTRISAADGNELTLKVDGNREYLMGNYQLLQYERVRQCLKETKPTLKLILTEIKTDHSDVFFPPLFKIDKSITYPIKHVKAYQLAMYDKKLIEWQNKKAIE